MCFVRGLASAPDSRPPMTGAAVLNIVWLPGIARVGGTDVYGGRIGYRLSSPTSAAGRRRFALSRSTSTRTASMAKPAAGRNYHPEASGAPFEPRARDFTGSESAGHSVVGHGRRHSGERTR